MGDIQRLTAEAAKAEDPFSWAASLPEPEKAAEPRFTAARAKQGAKSLKVRAWRAYNAALEAMNVTLPAAQHLEEDLDATLLVEAVHVIQQARKELAQVEAYLSRVLGKAAREMPTLKTGEVPGVGTYEVRGGATRKAWDHEAWKGDVRREIVTHLELDGLAVINPETGEEVPLDLVKTFYQVLELAQSVHGSAAPKVTALRPLNLSADDYCETYAGPFTITITPDAEAAPGSAEEDTNA